MTEFADPSVDLPHIVEVAIDLIDFLVARFEGPSFANTSMHRLRSDQQFPDDLSKAIGAACLHKVLTDAGIADPDLHSPREMLRIIKNQLQTEPEVFWEECWEVREVLARVENVRKSYRWDRFESVNFAIAHDEGESETVLDELAKFCWSNRHAKMESAFSPVMLSDRSLFSYLDRPKKRSKK